MGTILNTAGCPSSTLVLPSDGVPATMVSTRMSTPLLLWVAKKFLEDLMEEIMELLEEVSMLVEPSTINGEPVWDSEETTSNSMARKKKKKKMVKLNLASWLE